MNRFAPSFAAYSIAAAFFLLLNSSVCAQTAEQCHNRDYLAFRDEGVRDFPDLLGLCIDAGHSVSGPFTYDDLEPTSRTNNPLRVTGDLGLLEPEWLAHGCVSRLLWDRVCLQNEQLFSARRWKGYCPLRRALQLTELDVINSSHLFGGSRSTCTEFDAGIIPNGLQVFGATDGRIATYFIPGGKRDSVIARNLEVRSSKIRSIDLGKFVFQGDLVVKESSVRYLTLKEIIVVGDIIFDSVTALSVEFEDVWVTGDVIFKDNSIHWLSLKGVTLNGIFRFKGNRGVSHEGRSAYVEGDLLAIGAVETDIDDVCPEPECVDSYTYFRRVVHTLHQRHSDLSR